MKKDLLEKLDKIVRNLPDKDFQVLKTCMVEGAGLLLTPGIDEKEEIIADLQDAISILAENHKDFEKAITNWKGGDWETTIACWLLTGNIEQIRNTAKSLRKAKE